MNRLIPKLFTTVILCLGVSATFGQLVNIPLSNATGGTPLLEGSATPWRASDPNFTLDDPFLYDPNDPTSVLPYQLAGNDTLGNASYFITLNTQAENYWECDMTIPAGVKLSAIDMWSRQPASNATVQQRAKTLVITLSNGVDADWVSDTWNGVNTAGDGYGRFTFADAASPPSANMLKTATHIHINNTNSGVHLEFHEIRLAGTPNTWDGGAWSSDSAPDNTQNVILDGNFDFSIDGSFAANDLTINTGVSLIVSNNGTLDVNGDIVNNGSVTVASGASLLTYSPGTVTGNNITFNRTTSFADGKYSFVSSPVVSDPGITGADLGSFTYSYDETVGYDADAGLGRWIDASSTQLVAGHGYTQANQSVISFSGIPNDGTITISGLTKTTTGTASANDQGWHLLGNPYPAALDVTAFIAGNGDLEGSISIWDDGGSGGGRRTNADYFTANVIGTVGAPNTIGKDFEGYIGSMQGFFVQASTDNVSVSFTEAMRVSGNNADATFFRKSTDSNAILKLALESADEALYNETLIGLREDATLGKDRLYDAAKLKGNNSLQFYSYLGEDGYAIQGIPNIRGTEVSLGYDYNHDLTDLTLKVIAMDNLEDGMTFLLTDHHTGEVYDLSKTTSLSFSSTVGSDISRFSVKYVLDLKDQGFALNYKLDSEILKVFLPEEVKEANYVIYDMVGKVGQSQDVNGLDNGELSIPVSGIKGLKVVKVIYDGKTEVRKFFF